RGDRRVGTVIRAVWEDGGRFDGWSEHFSYERWTACAEKALADEPVDLDWYTTRERDENEVLPWDHLDAGLDREWLWQDWQDAIDPAGAAEVEDCRWTPCYDCGVCPQMGTEIQIGPTGKRLLPIASVRGRRAGHCSKRRRPRSSGRRRPVTVGPGRRPACSRRRTRMPRSARPRPRRPPRVGRAPAARRPAAVTGRSAGAAAAAS